MILSAQGAIVRFRTEFIYCKLQKEKTPEQYDLNCYGNISGGYRTKNRSSFQLNLQWQAMAIVLGQEEPT